jgi:hypothetical protein
MTPVLSPKHTQTMTGAKRVSGIQGSRKLGRGHEGIKRAGVVRPCLSYTTVTAVVIFFLLLPSRFQHVLERFQVGSNLALKYPFDDRIG